MTHAYAALPVPGSRRHPVAGARRVGDADPDATVFTTVVLRRGTDDAGAPAAQADVDAVSAFASQVGLDVVSVSLPARTVRLRGDVATMNTAFGVHLGNYETPNFTYRGRQASIYIPEQFDGMIVAVLGLDNRPQARAHFRIVAPNALSAGSSPVNIASGYGFPTDVDGSGQTVAVIELGGGFTVADLDTYFSGQNLRTPSVEAVSVDGATNSPGDEADGEVMLDIEVIGAIAQGAKIAVYFGPNTNDGFYDAIAAAIHDTVRKPSIISISWGQSESEWTASALDADDALFADAAAAGISVFVACGDNGATDGATDGGLHVDFPASSPSAVACGGTTLHTDGTEVVWNETASNEGATGGGFSHHFAMPSYQVSAGVTAGSSAGDDGRGVPDVAGDADPTTGYLIRFDGQDQVIGGTSAVAPLWAALTALANERNGASAGAPHARLYATPSAFRDITTGDNGGFSAAAGWDPCTGLGSPNGDLTIAALAPIASTPADPDPADPDPTDPEPTDPTES
jgi:kumamolisin